MQIKYDIVKKSFEYAKVSVIIPTYDRWNLLSDAIKSVINQTYPCWEIVVVNDGAGAPEGKAAQLLKHPRITYVEHKQNSGRSAARNTGIACSSGEYIAYLDDDDIFYPNHLEIIIGEMTKNGWDVAYTDAYKGVYEKIEGNYRFIEKEIELSCDFKLDKLWQANFIPILCVVHRKDCLKKTGGFDTSFDVLEDWDLWLRMSLSYCFSHIALVTAEYRVCKDNTNSIFAISKDVWDKTSISIYKKYLLDSDIIKKKEIRKTAILRLSRLIRKSCQKSTQNTKQDIFDEITTDMLRYMTLKDWLKLFFKKPFFTLCLKIRLL